MNKLKKRRLINKFTANKTKYISLFAIVFVLLLGVTYAALNTKIFFNGNATINYKKNSKYKCDYPSGTFSAEYTVNSIYETSPSTYNATLIIYNEGSSDINDYNVIIEGPSDINMITTAFVDSYVVENNSIIMTPASWANVLRANSNQYFDLQLTTAEEELNPTIYVNGCRVYADEKNQSTYEEITGLSFSSNSYTIAPSENLKLSLSITPSGASGTINWTSNNQNIATVDQNGIVTALQEGTTIITAQSNNISTSCTINVQKNIVNVKKLTLSQTTATMNTNDTLQLNYSKNPNNANSTVEWGSSNTSIATVNSNGLVTAINPGTVTIYVRSNDITSECIITIEKGTLTNLSFPSQNVTMSVGDSETLNLIKTPSGASEEIIWTSSNQNIATIDEKGMISALRTGTTTITASSGDISATCNIIVVESSAPQTSVVPSTPSINIYGQDVHYSINITNNSNNNVSYFRVIIDVPENSYFELWTGPEFSISNNSIVYSTPSWATPIVPGQSIALNGKITIPSGYNANDYASPKVTIIGIE